MTTLQARPKGEELWYSPARDISCLTPELIRRALEDWDDDTNVYRRVWARYSVDDAEIGRVAEALAALVSRECVIDAPDWESAIKSSGLHSCLPLARAVVLAMVAERMLGSFWFGIRSATVSDKAGEFHITQYTPADLSAAASALVKQSGRSRVTRWIVRKVRGVIGGIRACLIK